jgi:hypothetical protein
MGAEFTNEGFNVGYRAGVLSERERIIALLEAQLEGVLRAVNKSDWTVSEEIVSTIFRGDIIALIKGEN